MVTEFADVRLLSIVEESARFVREQAGPASRVAALSTSATFQLRFLLDELERDGFSTVVQSDEVQSELVQRAIFDPDFGIKAQSDPVSDEAQRRVREAITHVAKKGADSVVLGCTELPLAVRDARVDGVTTVDPTLALARGLIRESYPTKLRPLA